MEDKLHILDHLFGPGGKKDYALFETVGAAAIIERAGRMFKNEVGW